MPYSMRGGSMRRQSPDAPPVKAIFRLSGFAFHAGATDDGQNLFLHLFGQMGPKINHERQSRVHFPAPSANCAGFCVARIRKC